MEFPPGFVSYKKSPVFAEGSIPQGLQSQHSTKKGVWGKIQVLAGQLEYTLLPPINRKITLQSVPEGIIVAEVLHYVKPQGTVRFYVEFFRKE